MTNEQLALITSDPLVLHGQAMVAGTRVTVSVVLDCLAAGMSESEILAEYPSLTAAGIRAAAAYGAHDVAAENRGPAGWAASGPDALLSRIVGLQSRVIQNFV
ncbi:MAG: DUF433 domain-containing protein [Acidimicrobiia bacterium]